MTNSKRKGPKSTRAGCMLCKPHKHQGMKKSYNNQIIQKKKAIMDEKEQIEELERDDRGWQYYAQIKKDRYGGTVTVKESSICGRPCVWIFCSNEDPNYENPPPHLTVAQAKKVIKGLQKFVDEAEDPEHWRNDPEYQKAWG